MGKYLKMADVFSMGVAQEDSFLVSKDGEDLACFICYLDEDRDLMAKYASHAINSHDELVAEVERLRMSSELAIITLEEVDRVLTEKIKNGSYDLDDISVEVAYALERLSEHE